MEMLFVFQKVFICVYPCLCADFRMRMQSKKNPSFTSDFCLIRQGNDKVIIRLFFRSIFLLPEGSLIWSDGLILGIYALVLLMHSLHTLIPHATLVNLHSCS